MHLTSTVIVVLIGTFSALGQQPAKTNVDRDLLAIEELHKKDIAAAKVGDVDTLATLWTDDAVALPPNKKPVIGISAIREWLNENRLDTTKVQITEYVFDFKEVRVIGNHAFEWARIRISSHPKGAPSSMQASGNLLRVLRRQTDGSWKVARAIWNLDEPSQSK
jgi:uncharacterized protein (TIGR02246 family)